MFKRAPKPSSPLLLNMETFSLMSKRDREEGKRIIVQGLGQGVRAETLASFFNRCGHIQSVRFTDRKSCVIEFSHCDSVNRALHFNSTRQPHISDGIISVIQDSVPGSKKHRHTPSSFIIMDSPAFNNFIIPTLPQNLHMY